MRQHLETCDACTQSLNGLTSPGGAPNRPVPHDPPAAETLPEWALLSGGVENSPAAAVTRFRQRVAEHVEPGQRLGQYELLAVLGRGGMGVVLKARHVKLDRVVAIKVLSPNIVQNTETLRRFEREMQAVARLDQPHIVRAFDADEIDNIHFMVMEFVDGIDLSALVKRRGPLPVPDACELVRQAAVGLQHVYENNMVHRDLKPGNLMLTPAGLVKLLDLGLALFYSASADGTELTATGQLMGTIDYMSPEQADNTHAVDIRSDIYSLGATLFALLVGHAPFGGVKYKSQFRKIAALATQTAPSLQSFRADVPRDLADIVAKMLAHDVGQRVATPQEMIEHLLPFCPGADLAARFREAVESPRFVAGSSSLSMEESSSLLRPDAPTIDHPFGMSVPTVSLRAVSATDRQPRAAVVAGGAASLPRTDGITSLHGIDGVTSLHGTHGVAPILPPRRAWRHIAAAALLVLLIGLLAWTPLMNRDRIDSQWQAGQTAAEVPAGNSTSVGAGSGQPASDGSSLIPPDATAASPVVAEAERGHPSKPASRIAGEAVERLRSATATSNDLHDIWDLLEASADPTIRTSIIHQAAAAGVDPLRLAERLENEQRPSVQAALLLALGDYQDSAALDEVRRPLMPVLLEWFRTKDDPGLHSAAEWLLRRWGCVNEIEAAMPVLQQRPLPRHGGWYATLQGDTMVVIPGPATFTMGSPEDEADRISDKPLQDETRHTETIPRTFAIATKEVTRQQFFECRPDYWKRPAPSRPHLPHNNCTWDAAAWYCNRLSEREGIPEDQWCYEFVPDGDEKLMQERPNALNLAGYRLPTDSEWELACRAGTLTAQPFGRDRTMLAHYAFGDDQAKGDLQLPAQLKPNELGLFDMLGNISEWAHDTIQKDAGRVARRLRGGSVWTPPSGLRSAARYHYDLGYTNDRAGFRVARTIVSVPRQDEPYDLLAGPPADLSDPATVPDETAFEALEFQDAVTLGSWDRGSVPARWFRIRNNSDQGITLRPHAVGQGIQLESASPATVAPGNTWAFSIRLDDTHIGYRSTSLIVEVSDPHETRSVRLDVNGCINGAAAVLMERDHLGADGIFSFGAVPRGTVIRHTFAVVNNGNRPLNVRNVVLPAGFRLVGKSPGKIDSHGFGHITVVVDTDVVGDKAGVLQIHSDDPARTLTELPLAASVVSSTSFSTPGVFRDGLWMFDSNFDSEPDEQFHFGLPGDTPVTGDWNGDGIGDVGICRAGERGMMIWKLCLRSRNADAGVEPQIFQEFSFGSNGGLPLSVRQSGSRISSAVVACKSAEKDQLRWLFRTPSGDESEVFQLPAHGTPVVGDWDGDGSSDLASVLPPVNGGPRNWLIQRKHESQLLAEYSFGIEGDIPIVGDWDGDGVDEVGVFRVMDGGAAEWMLDIAGDGHLSEREFRFGQQGDLPVVLSGLIQQEAAP